MHAPDGMRLGIMARREHAPETLPELARRAEAAGFAELWVVEDCGYGGGIAAAAVALASTRTIAVGLGILPAVVRNPVFAAMEIATLARSYPGRFLPGFGHGVADWMRQVGALPASQLTALEEVTLGVRQLLAGGPVTLHGRFVQLDQVRLEHPPAQIPPVALGVIGPRSLALAGRVADGTILSEYAAPTYVTWARAQIARGQREAGRADAHQLTVFAFACAAATTATARLRVRPMLAAALASADLDAKLEPLGLLPEVRALRERGGEAALAAAMPDAWIDQLVIAGTPADWRAALARFAACGVHALVLVPLPDAGIDAPELFARHLAL